MESVWVIWDPLYEKVISVHKTEESTDKELAELNEKEKRNDDCAYLFNADLFEIKD